MARTLDRAAVALRAVIATCLLTLAVTALLPGPHAGHASAEPSPPPVHVVGVSVGGTSVGHPAVEVRLAAPLPTVLTCPVSGPGARTPDQLRVVVHI